MAPYIPVPEVACAHIRGQLNAQPVENTLYFHRGGGWDSGTLAVAAAYLQSWFFVSVIGGLSQEYEFKEVYMVDLTTNDGAAVSNTTGAGTNGGIASATSSNQIALKLAFGTGRRGRSWRGGNYIPGVPESKVDNSLIDDAWANGFKSSYEVLLGAPELLGGAWVHVSRYHNKEARPVGLWAEVLNVSIKNYHPATQRRRRGA